MILIDILKGMDVKKHTVISFAGIVLTAIPSSIVMVDTALAQEHKLPDKIKRVDIVHMSHTDVGFTDHPAVCREQQTRYIDIAIDGVMATENAPKEAQFSWTAEAALTVDDWWQKNSPDRRQDLICAIKTGRLEITALAMNQTPTLSADEWRATLHWLPDEVWNAASPKTAIQNDVNGFPRAGAMALLDRMFANLFMGSTRQRQAPFQCPWPSVEEPDGPPPFRLARDSYPDQPSTIT